MKSRISIKGHPVHPVLVAFPTAFLTGALVFDLLAFFCPGTDFGATATYLELLGLLTGLAAAVPGVVDLFTVLPPQSSAKKRGYTHGILNVSMMALFALALVVRLNMGMNLLVICLEAIGFILMLIAGWMGGTLVYRNQVGVYNRYASSGKWKEAYIKGQGRVEVATSAELKNDQMKLLHVNGRRIVLARTNDRYVAFSDRCTHKGGSLAGGVIICGTVQCPWHGSQFNASTGAVEAGPAQESILTYNVEESGGRVYLLL